MTRYAKRTDDNHSELVERLRAALPEATVFDLSGAGRGIPDLLLGYKGRNYLIEIKDGEKAPSKRQLTEAQKKFHDSWQGQVAIATSPEGAVVAILRDYTKDQ
jgi:hypothetical protein